MNEQSIYLPTGPARATIIARLGRMLNALPAQTAFRVSVEEHRPKRSDAQNRYLWGVVYATILKAGNLEGWEAEDVHRYLTGEFGGWETLEGLGRKSLKPIVRTSTMNKQIFADYIAFIQKLMAEKFGIYVPDPNEEIS